MRIIRILLFAACMMIAAQGASAQDAKELTSFDIIEDMAPGWNLGNTLEATPSWTGAALWNNKGGLGSETGWQDTKTTQEIIDYVRDLGFKSVRIPCAWAFGHISNASTYEINAAWMARVKEVVDYCINDGLYVLLNDHWDGGWLEEHIKDSNATVIENNKKILTALWTQIANEFKDYDHHLLFAGLNEPVADNQAATNNLIQYNQTFVDAVRATGGNNLNRLLVVQGPSTNIDYTCSYMANKMPTDVTADRLAVEVHYYDPWQFWGMENDESWGKVFYYWGSDNHLNGSTHNATWGEESYMKDQLQKMKTKFIDQGYPVVIGEFGANWRDLSSLSNESQEKHNASIRAHYREMHRLCKEFGGMVPMTWDINSRNQNGTKGTMTIVDRKNLTVFGTYAMEGINDIYPSPVPTAITQTTVTATEDDALYTLQGIRLPDSHLQKSGIYISNGKKVVIK